MPGPYRSRTREKSHFSKEAQQARTHTAVLPWIAIVTTVAALLTSVSNGQASCYNGDGTAATAVSSPSELTAALTDPVVSSIALKGNISLNQATLRGALPISIGTGRNVTLIGLQENGEQATLDFGQLPNVLNVQAGGAVIFCGIALQGIASRSNTGAGMQRNLSMTYTYGILTWPSITVQPESEIYYENTDIYFPTGDCSQDFRRAILPYQVLFGGDNVVQTDNTVLIKGFRTIANMPVQNYRGQQVGDASVYYNSTNMTCVSEPPSEPPGSSGVPWWVWLLVTLSSACLVAALAGAAAVQVSRKQRKALQQQQEQQQQQQNDPADDAPKSVEASQQPGLPQALSRTLSQTQQDPLSGSGASAQELSTVLWRTRTRRSSAAVADLEVGPLLGSGGFGSVYKAKWKGVLIALKKIDRGKRRAPDAPAALESLLAASVSHPNVVATYQVCEVELEDQVEVAESESSGVGLGETRSTEAGEGRSSGAGDTRSSAGDAAAALQIIEEDVDLARAVARAGAAEAAGPSLELDVRSRSSEDGPRAAHVHSSLEESIESRESRELRTSEETPRQLQTWLLLEYCDRGSLQDAVRRRFNYVDGAPADAATLMNIYRCLLDITSGLEYLHSVGILHGDLKTANVVCKSTQTDTRGFMCKLADFGLSKLLDTEALQSHISTQTFGTVAYMAAEMLSAGRMSKAGDIYSLGTMMWELYTGQVPYEGLGMGQVFYKVVVLKEQLPDPRGCPEGYTSLLRRCMHPEPSKRPITAEVTRSLNDLFRELRGSSPSPSQKPPASDSCNTVRPVSDKVRQTPQAAVEKAIDRKNSLQRARSME